jgi:predicted TIM-barrel fold metal-dependent hydrolase
MTRQGIIDTHVHFSDFGQTEYDLKWVWLEPDFIHPILGDIGGIKARKYTIDEIWGEARFADVSGFVHVQAAIGSADPVEETRWLTAMREDAPVPFTIVGHADLGTADGIPQLEAHLESPYFVGIRDFMTEAMFAQKEVNPTFEQSLQFMTQRNVVLDMDCEWMNMGEGLALAQRHPELQIVLEHIGFPRARDDEYFGNWDRSIRELASAQNVTCKISGLAMTDPRFTRDSLRRWVDTCVEAFGPERCVLGSNWPVDRLYSSYDVILDLYREYISALSESEQAAILNGNANRLYRVL